jgi:O-antigen ligase
MNVTVLLLLTAILLALFVFYSVFLFYHNQKRNNMIDGNIRINATGKPLLFSPIRSLLTFMYSSRPSTRTFPNSHRF